MLYIVIIAVVGFASQVELFRKKARTISDYVILIGAAVMQLLFSAYLGNHISTNIIEDAVVTSAGIAST